MSASRRWTVGSIALGLALLCSTPEVARAQQQPSQPFAPAWGMLAGLDAFVKKGCGKCHAVRGFGGGIGPDLGRLETGKSFFELAAAMWTHLPRMGARMRELGIERPTLTPRELSGLIAFLFTAQYYDELGNAAAGEKLFKSKGCAQCHEVGGRGGRVGPGLDFMRRMNSPVLVAAAMWNHGPSMAETMAAKGIPRPTFQGRELVDLVAYIVTVARDGAGDMAQVLPGAPERGEKLFAERQCATCHSVGGKGGKVGPDLGTPRHHLSLTRFAALMWNHAPPMWARMKERGIRVPRLAGQEMADVVAYLYASHYFDSQGNSSRGRELVQSKGCLGCHSVRAKGGKGSADFATSTVVGSPAGVTAGMWNHSALMEASAQRQEVAWPALQGQDLRDISAYLASLRKAAPPKSK